MFLFAVAPGAAGRGGRCLPAGAEGMDRYHSPSNIGREEPRSRSSPQFVADSLLEGDGFELLVRERGASGCSRLLTRPVAWDGSAAGGVTRPPRLPNA